MLSQIPLTIAESWISNALGSDLMLLTTGIALVCIALFFVLIRAMVRLSEGNATSLESVETSPVELMADAATKFPGRSQQATRSFAADNAGTTSLEFTLVLPILMFLALLLVQSIMLMAGNMFVHHAAYWATRQAIIEIPTDYESQGGLEANLVSNNRRSEKYERIHKVASLRLVPVAGRQKAGIAPAEEVVEAVRAHFAFYGKEEPAWIDSMLADKVNYAFDNTKIEVLNTYIDPVDPFNVIFEQLPSDPFKFGVRDPITVSVTHRLALGVPVVSRIFADGDDGEEGTGRYTNVTAQYTLTNEGVPVPLPEKPSIDRITPNLPELPPGENEDPNQLNPN